MLEIGFRGMQVEIDCLTGLVMGMCGTHSRSCEGGGADLAVLSRLGCSRTDRDFDAIFLYLLFVTKSNYSTLNSPLLCCNLQSRENI